MAGPTWENPVKSFFRQFDIDSMKDSCYRKLLKR